MNFLSNFVQPQPDDHILRDAENERIFYQMKRLKSANINII